MGFKVLEFVLWVLIISSTFTNNLVMSSNQVGIQEIITKGNILVDGNKVIGKTDTNFVCATLDWWPHDKCDYGSCSWNQSSLLNLDLNNKILMNAVKAFSPLKLRLGGTLQDRIIYETEDSASQPPPCIPFSKNSSSLFGFNKGCLPLRRWDQLNTFFNKSGAMVVFGLNVLNGRSIKNGSVVGSWDPTNAKSLIEYSLRKGYNILGWELGNELTGTGSAIRIEPDQYASDIISFNNVIWEAYKNEKVKPLILAPGGFFNPVWFKEFLHKTTSTHLDVVTHHIYNLGPGSDKNLVDKILNPSVFEHGVVDTFKGLRKVINNSDHHNSVQAWVGEAGGVYNSGRNQVTNTFLDSFWYLDQLGLASTYDTKTYCRQSLVGGNYGMLNTTTFKPNPDYYSALLWHRLMGKKVLWTNFSGSKKIRAYAHCSKQSRGITLLLINLDKRSKVEAKLKAVVNGTSSCRRKHRSGGHHHHHHGDHIHRKRIRVREEYGLTGKDGNLQNQSVLLNGKELNVDDEDNIPPMEPVIVNAKEPITIAPLSILFVHIPYLCLPACS
ncbi:heparanase-like protein 3 [Impatiens glandulifera]|uniref:heparanase-like protein 3 n=1 Tax=Impatiens glandulifera TaxID=253017 RepID=UPI001FB0BA81|nr:heparanase-like protein 3 [Impatiens glandulifera]